MVKGNPTLYESNDIPHRFHQSNQDNHGVEIHPHDPEKDILPEGWEIATLQGYTFRVRKLAASNIPIKHGADIPEKPPIHNDLPALWDMVMQDMIDRDKAGVKKYGTRLQPFNGRDALWDAYQEALDMAVDMRQYIYEEEHKKMTYVDALKFLDDKSILFIENLLTDLIKSKKLEQKDESKSE
jgi:hypothetical protein